MAERSCMDAALRKLNYRMRTRAELKAALKELEYEEDEINETLEELESFGYLDDMKFSEEFIRSYSSKNWSSSRLIRALKEKGISQAMAEEAMDNYLNPEETGDSKGSFDRERALETGLRMAEEQRARGKNFDEKFFGKVGRRLMSLGYDSSTCYYVIGRLREQAKSADIMEGMP